MCLNYQPGADLQLDAAGRRRGGAVLGLQSESKRFRIFRSPRIARAGRGSRQRSDALVYGLVALGLPLRNKQADPEKGLAFAFLADPEHDTQESDAVMTGHAHGLITINIAEANDAEREQRRLDLNERLPRAFRRRARGLRPSSDRSRVAGVRAVSDEFSLHVATEVAGVSAATPGGVTDYRPRSPEAMIESWLPLTNAINMHQPQHGAAGHVIPSSSLRRPSRKLSLVHRVIGERNRRIALAGKLSRSS